MVKRLLVCFISAFLLSSCASPLFTPPTPTPTPSSTPTITPLPSSTFTPMPTSTETLVPTETLILPLTSVKNRQQFEELVKADVIKCYGYDNDEDGTYLDGYINEVLASGAFSKKALILGSGIPSRAKPSQCLFVMVFDDGKSIVMYKDSKTQKFVSLPMTE